MNAHGLTIDDVPLLLHASDANSQEQDGHDHTDTHAHRLPSLPLLPLG